MAPAIQRSRLLFEAELSWSREVARNRLGHSVVDLEMPRPNAKAHDPALWLALAEEARVLAGMMKSDATRLSMLAIAACYDRTAERIKDTVGAAQVDRSTGIPIEPTPAEHLYRCPKCGGS